MLFTDGYSNSTDDVPGLDMLEANTTAVSLPSTTNGGAADFLCHQYMGFVVNSLAAGVVCLLGFAGNSLSFLILTRDKETPIASFLLKSLACVDNAFLGTWFLHFSLADLFMHFKLNKSFHAAWLYVRVYTYPLIFVTQTGTIYITVLIAATRYLAVCKPYLAVTWGRLQNIKIGTIAVLIFSVLYNLPRFFETKIIVKSKNETVIHRIKRTWMGASDLYTLIYFDIMYYIFSFILPLLLLAVLNTKLIIAYRAVRTKRRESFQLRGDRENNDHNITLVMIIVVLTFMLCNAPARLVQIIWAYKFVDCESFVFLVIKISNVLEVFNSSINFVIYCVFRKQFRQVLKVQCCAARRPGGDSGAQQGMPFRPLNGSPRTADTTAFTNINLEESNVTRV